MKKNEPELKPMRAITCTGCGAIAQWYKAEMSLKTFIRRDFWKCERCGRLIMHSFDVNERREPDV